METGRDGAPSQDDRHGRWLVVVMVVVLVLLVASWAVFILLRGA